ncbi:MAG: hypothetical protein JHC57_07865 [Sphingopyxis sp.]|uniref:hypothetical protein n=1 Tax=Sphingopyxis sp. TaxID=1908224 RepID=UPI001A17FAEC|nr:hypothetical protein [Sphingopyxis sp.]MBJ7499652.1 hypothetical protein [Sphingopyxis sp.]
MPLWLDMLRTPMAAPETGTLRRWRFCWLVLCLSLAATIAAQRPLREVAGRWAPAMAAVLLLATILVGLIYFRRKGIADQDWLARFVDGDEP